MHHFTQQRPLTNRIWAHRSAMQSRHCNHMQASALAIEGAPPSPSRVVQGQVMCRRTSPQAAGPRSNTKASGTTAGSSGGVASHYSSQPQLSAKAWQRQMQLRPQDVLATSLEQKEVGAHLCACWPARCPMASVARMSAWRSTLVPVSMAHDCTCSVQWPRGLPAPHRFRFRSCC